MNNKNLWLTVLVVFVFACRTEKNLLVIPVSRCIQDAVNAAAPADRYGFYALQSSAPHNLEELAEATLLLCGDIEDDTELEISSASVDELNRPLFKSVHRHIVNPNLLTGRMVISENVNIALKTGGTVQYSRETFLYGKDTPLDSLVQQCLMTMHEKHKSVLLMEKNVDSELLKQMTRIIFKQN